MELPGGEMQPAGYVVLQHAVRLNRPVKAYSFWMARIPEEYRKSVVAEKIAGSVTIETDPHCLATLKHYGSLMPLAQEARKPMFFLKPADGAMGSHMAVVQACYMDFSHLAKRIPKQCGVTLS